MKKGAIILAVLFLVPLISSVEFDIKERFDQGETLIARISGNFIDPILKENVFFYRGHVRIPMEYDVTRINDEFYIYALLSKPENNYSISIENVKYKKGAETSYEKIVRNFTITNKTADFSVNPGFVKTMEDFSIEVLNLQDKTINVSVDKDMALNLKSGESKKINFGLKDLNEHIFKKVEISTKNLKYEIPVYLFTGVTPKKENKIKFEPSEFRISVPTNSKTERVLYLYNIGEEVFENLTILVSDSLIPYVSFSLDDFTELEPDSNLKLNLFINSDSEEKKIEGQITAFENGIYAYSGITLNFIKDFIPENASEIVESPKTCEEMNGDICEAGIECNGETVYAKDDKCCIGTCWKKQESSTGKIIGWSIIGVLFILLLWFFKKRYFGAKKEINLFKLGKK